MDLTNRSGIAMGIRQGGDTRQSEDRLDIVALLSRLWKLKFIVICLTILLMIPAAMYIFSLQPQYKAEGQIMIDDRRVQMLGVADVLSAHSWSEAAVLSEVQVLSSRDLAKAVIAKLHLDTDPSFNHREHSGISWRDHLRSLIGSLPYVSESTWLAGLVQPEEKRGDLNNFGHDYKRLTDEFLANLAVLPTGRSNVLRVQFDSSSPETAARVVNTVAELYLSDQVKRKVEAARATTRWIEDHLGELRVKTEEARRAKEDYMRRTGVFYNDRNSTIDTQQLSDLTRQLSTAMVQASTAEARFASATAAKTAGSIGSLMDVNISPQVQSLRQAQASLLQKIATLQATYGAGHPLVAQAEAQLQDVRRSLGSESQRVLQTLASEVDREKTTVAGLQSAIAAMKVQVSKTNEAQARLATLDHDVVAADAIYQLFLDRVKQTEYQQNTQESDSQLISRADPPQLPYFPNRGMLLLLAGITCSVSSTAIAILFDHRKKTFMAVNQIRFELGSEVLGIVPMVKRLGQVLDAHQLGSKNVVGAPFAESIRNLQVRLMISSLSAGALPRSILFASAYSGEGKSTTAIAFAIVAATRRRVLIIDCDTRRPQVHTAFQVQRGPGLTDYLEGRSLNEVIQAAEGYSLDVITSGKSVPHPADLLGTDAMRSLLSAVKDRYDCIVIDTPPVLAVPDAMVLAPVIDRTVLMVQWGKTPQAAVERALVMLTDAGANLAGVVLSKVRMDKIPLEHQHEKYYAQLET